MKIENKIGWQKYEDMLQSQMDSPFLESIYGQMVGEGYDDDDDDDYDGFGYEEHEKKEGQGRLVIPFNERLMENIFLATNFDCWMGHTNFNITEAVTESLSKTAGVEVLKICSRYRFFVGIGKMFDFSEVRKVIEKSFGDSKGEMKNDKEDRQVPE